MDFIYSTSTENETNYFAQNDSEVQEIVPLSLTSAIFFSTPPKSNRSSGYNYTESPEQFQFYVIGIYSFFAIVFCFGIIIMLFKKFQKACCPSSKSDFHDYESVSTNRESLGTQDNLAFDNHVQISYVEVDAQNNGHDSDYDYYSDASNSDKDISKDKPPAYEDPPSYSILLQE